MEALKDILVIVCLIYLVRRRVQIGHVLFFTALLFGILHQVSLVKLGTQILSTLTMPSTLTIIFALILITLMENIMRYAGSQSRLVSGLKNLFGDPRIAMATLPAIIGLLPSPGGARFSAPLVEEAARDLNIKGEQNAAINYYYRHIWEYCLPLYPGNLLAATILKIPLNKFVLVMFPFTIITLLAGLVLYHRIPRPQTNIKKPSLTTWYNVLEGLMPIIGVMIIVLVFKLDIIYALLLVIASLLLFYRVKLSATIPMLKNALAPRLLYMVFAALYLRDVLTQSESIPQLLAFLETIGFTPILITIVFPLLIGLFTGIIIPGVSIALPVIITLAPPDQLLSFASLAFASNFVGVMLSPLHLCMIMSLEHFQADFMKTYQKLLLPEALILIFAVVYSFLLR